MTTIETAGAIATLELADFATPLASKADSEQAWHDDREPGVTASDIATLRSRAAWGRVVHDKLNGRSFGGNAATRNGHRLEPYLLGDAADVRGTAIVGNDRVWASKANPLHLATPDGFEHDAVALRGVEVKTHTHTYKAPKTTKFPGVPNDHYDQVQWSMHVFDLDEWVYVSAITEADGELPVDADPVVIPVPRDDEHIAELIEVADAFLAWREAGCPADDVSVEIRRAEEYLIAAHAENAAAAARLKRAWAQLEAAVTAEHPAAMVAGWSHDAGSATVTFARPAKRTALDREALTAAEPEKAAEIVAIEQALADSLEAATALYPKTTTAAPAKRVTIAKAKAA